MLSLFMLKEVFNKEDRDSEKCPWAVVKWKYRIRVVVYIWLDVNIILVCQSCPKYAMKEIYLNFGDNA